MSELHRRHFLVDSATVTGSAVITGLVASSAQAAEDADGKQTKTKNEEASFRQPVGKNQ